MTPPPIAALLSVSSGTAEPFDLVVNPLRVAAEAPFPDGLGITVEGTEAVRALLRLCPRYAPTPLYRLPALARRQGVGQVLYKHEGARLGLTSFKALGSVYAVGCCVREALSLRGDPPLSWEDLVATRAPSARARICVTSATDGNHGLGVAAAARLFGVRCVIFVHEKVSRARRQAIEAFGAEVVEVAGDYDRSVEVSAQMALRNGWQVISDTSWPGYESTPLRVMEGYTVLAAETLDALTAAGEPPPTHVFLQCGVGGLAAAVAAHLWATLGPHRPRVVLVEPASADCLFQSIWRGAPCRATGDLDTLMAGLSCGEVSPVAWRILAPAADAAIRIGEGSIAPMMAALAHPEESDPAIVAGPSGVAGLAALAAVAKSPEAREALMLGLGSRVLLVGSEGATDPEEYARLIAAASSI